MMYKDVEVWKWIFWFLSKKKLAKGNKKGKKISYILVYIPLHLVDDNMPYFQVSLQKFSGLSHPVTNSANFNALLTTLDFKWHLFWNLI